MGWTKYPHGVRLLIVTGVIFFSYSVLQSLPNSTRNTQATHSKYSHKCSLLIQIQSWVYLEVNSNLQNIVWFSTMTINFLFFIGFKGSDAQNIWSGAQLSNVSCDEIWWVLWWWTIFFFFFFFISFFLGGGGWGWGGGGGVGWHITPWRLR